MSRSGPQVQPADFILKFKNHPGVKRCREVITSISAALGGACWAGMCMGRLLVTYGFRLIRGQCARAGRRIFLTFVKFK